RRSLHEDHVTLARRAVERGHEAMLCIEGNLIDAYPVAAMFGRIKARLHGERDKRTFHRVALDAPLTLHLAQIGVVAQERAAHEMLRHRRWRRVTRIADHERADRLVADALDGDLVLRRDDPAHGH